MPLGSIIVARLFPETLADAGVVKELLRNARDKGFTIQSQLEDQSIISHRAAARATNVRVLAPHSR